MFWVQSHDGERQAYQMFRRHYSSAKNRQPKIRQFVGPGQKMVLIGFLCPALFVWRKAIFRKDGQQGVNCALFRNESRHRSSDMIREAMEVAWERWPNERLFTMVDVEKTASRRGKKNLPGHCFLKADWVQCGLTKLGLIILEAYPSFQPAVSARPGL